LPEENVAPLADDLIPEDLRDFILRHIDSIAQLEALLLLRRNPKETWTAEASAKRLYISEADATHVLDRLCADGLLGCNENFCRFTGQSDEQRQMVDRLADTYSRTHSSD
jgi:DNA-binding MarR family transcriptional regulator